LLDIAPKVDSGSSWIESVLDLLTGSDRIDIGGDRQSDLTARRPELLDVIASTYAHRLQMALLRDGPILLIQRRQDVLPYLKGTLDVTSYLRRATWDPHHFPVSYDALTADSDFSRALAMVARMLAAATSSDTVRGLLLKSAAALRPGLPEDATFPISVASNRFPTQWSVYKPAWSIAVAVLSRSSLLKSTGTHHGIEIAIEPWPLLERLLDRALDHAVSIALTNGIILDHYPKQSFCYLTSNSQKVKSRSVVPDGQLMHNGKTVATFEAKYSAVPDDSSWPERSHVFQALTTAAACESPLSVLVYPESFEPLWWTVDSFHGQPRLLAAIGLGLYSYRRGSGDRKRGEDILALIESASAPGTTGVVST
jgi:hypothetical protein